MASQFGLQHLPGGLHAAVLPYNRVDPIHRFQLGSFLRDVIEYEAAVHDAPFDRAGFSNVLRMLAQGKAEVLFFPAAWDVCAPHIVGATFNFRSLFLKRNGMDIDVDYGLYTEDVSLLHSKLKGMLAEKPDGRKTPEGGLGRYYEEESLRYFTKNGLSDGVFPVGRTFEFAPKNTKIIRIQKELGASLGTSNSSGLLRMEGLTSAMLDRLKFGVPVDQYDVLLPNGAADPDNFIVAWQGQGGLQKIYTGFTNGMSTFTSKQVTQCQIVTNGNLPNSGVIESVLASSLAIGEQKICADGWARSRNTQSHPFMASIPIGGDPKEVREAGFALGGNEVAARARKALGNVILFSPTHIHVNNEPEVLEALHSLDAKQRMLGPNPMQTGGIDLTDRLEAASGAQRPRLRLVVPESELLRVVA